MCKQLKVLIYKHTVGFSFIKTFLMNQSFPFKDSLIFPLIFSAFSFAISRLSIKK